MTFSLSEALNSMTKAERYKMAYNSMRGVLHFRIDPEGQDELFSLFGEPVESEYAYPGILFNTYHFEGRVYLCSWGERGPPTQPDMIEEVVPMTTPEEYNKRLKEAG